MIQHMMFSLLIPFLLYIGTSATVIDKGGVARMTLLHNEVALSFLVIGDWGGLPDDPFSTPIERAVSKELLALAAVEPPSFLLALGDNFYYDGVTSVDDPRFNETFEDVFPESTITYPWYILAGNHDWNGNVSAQLLYSTRSSRWKFPAYFYTLTARTPTGSTVGIVMIDTVVLCGHSGPDSWHAQPTGPRDRQWAEDSWQWVEDQLRSMQSYAYVLVAGHYPVWSVAEHGPTNCLVQRLDPLLIKYNVTAYLSGHDHTLEHLRVINGSTDMNYFVVGSSNFCDDSTKHKHKVPADSLKFHWTQSGGLARVRVTGSAMEFTFVGADGQALYSVALAPRAGDMMRIPGAK